MGAENKFAVDTSKRNVKQWAQGLLVLFVGLTIAHLGVSMFLVSKLGTDTFTILIEGISKLVGLSIGTCHVIALVLLMVIMLLTTKYYVKPGTIVCALCGGWIIDFFLRVFKPIINAQTPLELRAIIMIAGCIVLSFGMSIVIESNSGTGPNDLIAIVLTDKLSTKWSMIKFRFVRVTCDVLFTAIGYLLGGEFGAGTIIAALLIGPIVQFFLPINRKIIHKVFPKLDK